MTSRSTSLAAILGALSLALAACSSGTDDAGSAQPVQLETSADPAAASAGPSGGAGGGDAGEGSVGNLTAELALTEARIRTVNLDDDSEEFVDVCFRQRFQEIADMTRFTLQGPDGGSEATASSARIDEGRTNCVVVGFEAGTDLPTYTIAVAQHAAVKDVSGDGNVQGAVALGGSTSSARPGSTAGPDLVSVTRDPTLDRVTFVFDEQLNEETKPDAASVGFNERDGKSHAASEVVTLEDNRLTVQFDQENGDQVEDAVRFFVGGEVVEDEQGVKNPVGSNGPGTALPDLRAVTKAAGTTEVDYAFDRDVANVEPGAFLVYTDDGRSYAGQSATRPSSQIVRVSFPEVDRFSEQVVLATVTSEGGEANDSSADGVTSGAAALRTSGARPGATTGPDLTDIAVETRTGRVSFTFDENVNDDEAVKVDPALFHIIGTNGDLQPGTSFIQTRGNTIVIAFEETLVRSSVGATVDASAVQDFQGNESPVGSRFTTR